MLLLQLIPSAEYSTPAQAAGIQFGLCGVNVAVIPLQLTFGAVGKLLTLSTTGTRVPSQLAGFPVDGAT